jgi:hypothetical protein
MKADESDKKFDTEVDVTGDLDLAAARRPLPEPRRVNGGSGAEDSALFHDAIAQGLADLDEGRETDLAAARKRLRLPPRSHRS